MEIILYRNPSNDIRYAILAIIYLIVPFIIQYFICKYKTKTKLCWIIPGIYLILMIQSLILIFINSKNFSEFLSNSIVIIVLLFPFTLHLLILKYFRKNEIKNTELEKMKILDM